MSELLFSFEVVGGPFDGVPGLSWVDPGKMPPPPAILIGVCVERGDCGASVCKPGLRHVSFWTPDEEDVPLGVVTYEKQDEHVVRNAEGELDGRAIYAIGGLLRPANFGALAHEPVEGALPPLTHAGKDRWEEILWEEILRPAHLEPGRHERRWPR